MRKNSISKYYRLFVGLSEDSWLNPIRLNVTLGLNWCRNALNRLNHMCIRGAINLQILN